MARVLELRGVEKRLQNHLKKTNQLVKKNVNFLNLNTIEKYQRARNHMLLTHFVGV